MSNTGRINQSVTVSEYNTEHSKLFCALQALCLLHCSDVLHDSHRKVCTRCPQNLANPRDEECSCTAGTAHHLSCGPLAGVTSCPCSSARAAAPACSPGSPGLSVPWHPIPETARSLFCSWGLQQRAPWGLCQKHLEQEDSLYLLLPTSECREGGVSPGVGAAPHGGWESWGSSCSLGPLTLLREERTLAYGTGNIKPFTGHGCIKFKDQLQF